MNNLKKGRKMKNKLNKKNELESAYWDIKGFARLMERQPGWGESKYAYPNHERKIKKVKK
jgi:hypothetical protein